jgi:flagellar secretion chaperone FliS
VGNARKLYRENAVRGASRVGLVVLLYEQMIEDLRCAAKALDEGQIELRTRSINHAILVIGNLQSTLDFEQGGAVARNLDHFYNVLRSKLVEAQALASKQLLESQIKELLSLRDAWIEVDRAETSGTAQSGEAPGESAGENRLVWRG